MLFTLSLKQPGVLPDAELANVSSRPYRVANRAALSRLSTNGKAFAERLRFASSWRTASAIGAQVVEGLSKAALPARLKAGDDSRCITSCYINSK